MGLGDFVDSVGDAFDSGVHAIGDGVGKGVQWTTDKAADGLDALGADGAADHVRSAGETVADHLGAEVAERGLDESDDPKELVHGDVSQLHETVSHLKDFREALEQVGQNLRKLDTGDWQGEAADRFREKYENHPKKWLYAADACGDAGKALEKYAHTVSWAQQQAREAIEEYAEGRRATAHAKQAYDHRIAAFEADCRAYDEQSRSGATDLGMPPADPGDFHDTGQAKRDAAQHRLDSARRQRDEAAETAQHAVRTALEHAPDPSRAARIAMDLADAGQETGVSLLHLGGGALRAANDTIRLARTVNPLDPYNLTHPFQFGGNVATTLAGLTNTVLHPGSLPKAVIGTGWGHDPQDATGALIFNLVGEKGLGAVGRTVARAGAREAGESAARNALRRSGLRDTGRDFDCKRLGLEPVDLATGRMILPQTDVTLPGAPPLVFSRTFESSYRAGGWFGPTWSSTVDQRLDIDAEGVVLVGESGQLLAYPHPAVGVPTTPPTGSRRSLEITEDGDYVLTDPADGTRWYYTLHSEGRALLDEVSDRHGNHITFDYDQETGAPQAVTHSGGYRLLLTIDPELGRVTELRLATGDTAGETQLLRTYAYDENGHLTTVTNAVGAVLHFSCDVQGRIISWTDSNDSHFTFVYDEQDRCTSQGGAAGHLRAELHFGERDPETGLHTTVTFDSFGARTVHHVDDDLNVVAVTDPTGATTRTTYDRHDQVTSTTDPLGRTTRYTYDEAGHLTAVQLPDGSTSTSTYDADGRPTTTTGPEGSTWRQEYDEHGNLTAVTDPAGATTRYTYDSRGRVAAVTNPLGETTLLDCDAAGLPRTVTDPLGHRTSYLRDAFGRVTAVTDPTGATNRFTWTPEGKLATRIDPTGATESWTYDGEGNRLTHTDALGQTTYFEYTHFDLLTARTDPDGTRHEFTHDSELRLTRVTNPQGLCWEYSFDAAGRLVSESDFDDRVLAYSHDAAGHLISRTNALGETTTFRHDVLGRVVEKDAAGKPTSYAYDTAGRLLRVANPDAVVEYAYDVLGRATAETVNGRTLTRTLDALGRPTSRTTPAGHRTVYTYDAAGNRTSLTAAGRTLSSAHDAAGRETTRALGDAATLSQVWDPAGRLTSQSLFGASTPETSGPAPLHPLQQRTYGYRPDGHLVSLHDHLAGRTRRFALDRAGRVTGVQAEGWTESYAYDTAGNQVQADWPAKHPGATARGDRSYEGTRILRAGGVRYEYDALGRTTLRQKTRLSRKPDTWRYTWDTEDRLTSVTTPDGTEWRYLYDPLGRRIAKLRMAGSGEADGAREYVERTDFTWDGVTVTEQVTHALGATHAVALSWDYDGLAPVAQTERKVAGTGLCEAGTSAGGAVASATVGADDVALDPMGVALPKDAAQAPQSTIDERFFAIVTDLIGTPTELVTESGDIAWHTRTTLWGNTTWNRDATAYTPLRFPGQYFDPESELHYNYFRYYEPGVGRYLSGDPLGLAAGHNPTAYPGNPLSYTDPLGLAPDCAAARRSAQKVIDRASEGKRRLAGNYHGHLSQERELEILSRPDAVYKSTGSAGRLIYRQGEDIVITEGKGSKAGNLITSYGPSGPRMESGAKALGGSPSDPGLPVTHDDIVKGRIPAPGGTTLPPAPQIL
ncbi:putative T7SS-secreted protein [Streptomyces sp. NPDC059740]|uniref:putative T7SS-secreted protein n=1 Tax=Streptomyces sp. NPDC059740 TaxID=3346926 RepID=UPI0036662804